MSSSVSDDAPNPRLCHLKKRDDFNGYGFNLHAEKGKAGQFIGKIDPGSPSEHAHLKESDRIVEVNGTNIGNENHQQVVQRVKAVPDETKLLVVDAETDKYYKDKKIVIRGDMPNVLICNPDGTTVIQKEITSNGVAEETERPPSESSSQDIPHFPADAPRPRNSHLKLWPDFQGYGFNLHAEKGKPGQYIGNVDDGSPSEYAGLKQGDRIIEVNGENIARDNHADVVKKIKSDPEQTVLLVLDSEAEAYYKEKEMIVSSKQSNVDHIVCPDVKPQANGSEVRAEVNHVSSESEQDDNTSNERLEVSEDKPDSVANEEPQPTINHHDVQEVEVDVEVPDNVSDLSDEPVENDFHEENKAEAIAEYSSVNKSAPEPEREVTPEPVETKVNGQSDGEEAAEAISESIREMEQAVAHDEPPPDDSPAKEQESEPEDDVKHEPEEKLELNNNADVAQDYDIIANVAKQEVEEVAERAPTPEPERVPTPEPEQQRAPTPEPVRVPTPEPTPVVVGPVSEPVKPEPVKQPEPASPQPKEPVTVGGISFAGSAKEARERMSKKRRDEVKQQQLSSKDKYNLYMKM